MGYGDDRVMDTMNFVVKQKIQELCGLNLKINNQVLRMFERIVRTMGLVLTLETLNLIFKGC